MAVVTTFSIFERLLGFVYRIYLSRSIGSEGVGIYQISLTVFAMLLTIASSGIPITVSRLMVKYRAEKNERAVKGVISSAIVITILITLPLMIVFFAFQSLLMPLFFTDERCVSIFLVILPTLLFCSLYAVFRGVFWGNKDFMPYSIFEILEEICMIVVGIILINRATSIYQGAYFAGIAVAVSYVFSFTLSTCYFLYRGNRLTKTNKQLKPLIISSLPITLMKGANSVVNSIIAIILPLQLINFGLTSSEAISQFGSAFGMTLPMLFIPATVIGSFSVVLIPEISDNYYNKNFKTLKTNCQKALRFAIIIACFIIPIFISLGEVIGIMIFNDYLSGRYLMFFAIIMLPMAISMVSTSILNSMGQESKTLKFFIISAFLSLLCVYFLPQFMGIYALGVGLFASFFTTSVLNLILLNKKSSEKITYLKLVFKVLMIIIPTAMLGVFLRNILLDYCGLFLTILIATTLMLAFNFIIYLVFNIIEVSTIIKRFRRKKQTL